GPLAAVVVAENVLGIEDHEAAVHVDELADPGRFLANVTLLVALVEGHLSPPGGELPETPGGEQRVHIRVHVASRALDRRVADREDRLRVDLRLVLPERAVVIDQAVSHAGYRAELGDGGVQVTRLGRGPEERVAVRVRLTYHSPVKVDLAEKRARRPRRGPSELAGGKVLIQVGNRRGEVGDDQVEDRI